MTLSTAWSHVHAAAAAAAAVLEMVVELAAAMAAAASSMLSHPFAGLAAVTPCAADCMTADPSVVVGWARQRRHL